MLLEKEREFAIAKQHIDRLFIRSWFALAFLIASVVLILPPYFLTKDSMIFIRICASVAVILTISAFCLSVLGLSALLKYRRAARDSKYISSLVINLVILILISYSISRTI